MPRGLSMPVNTQCPNCRKAYSLADSTRGKKVRCKVCQQVFECRDDLEILDSADEAQAAIQTRAAVPPPLPARTPAREKAPRPDASDDDIAPPRRRAAADPRLPVAEPVDNEQLPRRRRPSERRRESSSALPWIIGGSVGGVVLIGAVVLVVVLLNREDPLERALADAQRDAQERLRQNLDQMRMIPNQGFKPVGVQAPPPPPPPAVNLLRPPAARFQVDARDHDVKDFAFA